MAIGLGVGIPLLLVSIGFGVYFAKKRRNRGGAGEQPRLVTNSGDGSGSEKVKGPTEDDAHGYSMKAELPADEKAAQVVEMDRSGVGDHKSPTAPPLPFKGSGKEDVYELQG